MQTERSADIEESLLPRTAYSPQPTKRSVTFFKELDYSKRIAIFIVLNIIGMFLTFGSVMRLFFAILTLDASGFALTYTIGNLLCLIAAVVLTGFKAQYESMIDARRRNISAVYFGSMLLCIALPMISTGFIARVSVLALVLVQFVAYYVFTLSYFPRVQRILASTLGAASKTLTKNN